MILLSYKGFVCCKNIDVIAIVPMRSVILSQRRERKRFVHKTSHPSAFLLRSVRK